MTFRSVSCRWITPEAMKMARKVCHGICLCSVCITQLTCHWFLLAGFSLLWLSRACHAGGPTYHHVLCSEKERDRGWPGLGRWGTAHEMVRGTLCWRVSALPWHSCSFLSPVHSVHGYLMSQNSQLVPVFLQPQSLVQWGWVPVGQMGFQLPGLVLGQVCAGVKGSAYLQVNCRWSLTT